MRPNIRVEIQNNLADAMEVDENEEGEISDHEDQTDEKHGKMQLERSKQGAQPGDVDKPDETKLQERAKRFCLKPTEIKNFKSDDLQLLHGSLGITPANEANVRLEVIHMRGIDEMTAADVLDYFLEYAPVLVEWIDEESCNVVWKDSVSAARAMHFMSKPVRGMPVRDDSSYFDALHEEMDQSEVLINKDREVQLKEDTEDTPNKLLNADNSVDIAEITATIPPGYWRLGSDHLKSKCLLLRFALKTDKKAVKVEQLSRYYKSQGKKKVATHGIFGRNKDMQRGKEDNPWSILARDWDEDAQFRERERNQENEKEVKSQSLRHRLGSKRKEEPEEEEEEQEEAPKKKVKIPRMRMYADEEEEKIKRKQMLKRINTQISKIDQDKSSNSDLRSVLNMTGRTHGVKLEKAEPETYDLGSRLKNRNKKMVFQIKSEHRHRRRRSEDEEEDRHRRRDYPRPGHSKPQSKVAVVIKTQKKPSVASAVASTVWSRVSGRESDSSESGSESESESASSQNESEAEEEEAVERRIASRPGFTDRSRDRAFTTALKKPLKIEINNDHFKKS